jgi:hypothetical protein
MVADLRILISVYGLCLVGAAIMSGTVPASGQELFTRTIMGVVVDKEEQPVVGAKVCAEGRSGMGGILPCAESDAKGRFSIDVYRPETYKITAYQLAQGYPRPFCGFYGSLFVDFPVVTIDDASGVSPVKIRLGPKAGRVIFTILDENDRRITSGMITVSRPGDPQSVWSTSTAFPQGRYELLTPDAPFTVTFATSSGGNWIKRAAFDEAGAPIDVLQVDLGGRKEITVRLR